MGSARQVALGHSLRCAQPSLATWPRAEVGAHRVPAHAWLLGKDDEVDETPRQVGQFLKTKCLQ